MSLARDIADLGSVTSRLDTLGTSSGALSNRNLIINGAMQVNQRGSYTITTTGSPEYGGPDRFHMWSYTSTEQVVGDVTQSTDVPSGNGFGYSRKFDVTTAESAVASAEALIMAQLIEARNLQHLEYGTSSAKDVTMSFWIKSTKTGTYCFFINQEDGSRIYVKEYTVNASDTWEKKTITIEGDASGTINNDGGRGFWVGWVLMAGTDRHGTANAWRATGADYATSNQVNAVDSTSNNIYLTGVQLEVGDTATDFEHRTFGDELARCQRYFQMTNAFAHFAGRGTGTTTAVASLPLTVPMRASPTLTTNSISTRGYTSAAIDVSSGTPSVGSYSANDNLLSLNLTGFDNLLDDRVINFQITGSANGATGWSIDAEL